MDWIKSITNAIEFIENNITNNICVDDVSNEVFTSPTHFQRVFSVVTGISIGEYIRNRRLSLSGQELALTDSKVIDMAFKYGYDTSESFSKAFSRFHGFPPSEAKINKANLKYFEPFSINIFVKGGFNMSRKIMENDQGIRLIRENFEYKNVGPLRFIGMNLKVNPNISFDETISKLSPFLDPLQEQY